MNDRAFFAASYLAFTSIFGVPLIVAPQLAVAQSSQTTARYINVQRVIGNVTYRNSLKPVKAGDRLTNIGQGISTGANSSAVLTLDVGVGTINVSANTNFVIKELKNTANGGKVTLLEVSKGQVRIALRPFTNPQSRLEVQTPAGIAGVRGTEFGVLVADDGQTNVLTNTGSVGVTGAGETVEVDAGYATIVAMGQPPLPPKPTQDDLYLEVYPAEWFPDNGWTVFGKVNPFNFVWVNGKQIPVMEDGSFFLAYGDALPTEMQAIRVLTPLGQTRILFTLLRGDRPSLELRGDRHEL
jgi:FecR protein